MSGLLFAGGGMILLLISVHFAMDSHAFLKTAHVVEGRVIKLNHGGAHPEIVFFPTPHTQVSYPQGGFIWGYSEGDKVQVLFDPDDPQGTARLNRVGIVWFWSILFALPGLAFSVGGVLAFVFGTTTSTGR